MDNSALEQRSVLRRKSTDDNLFNDQIIDHPFINFIIVKSSVLAVQTARYFLLLPIKSDETQLFERTHFKQKPAKRKTQKQASGWLDLGKGLYIPDISYFIFSVLVLIELAVISRYFFTMVNLSTIPEQNTFISVTKGVGSLAGDLKATPLNRGKKPHRLECNGSVSLNEQQLETLINERYQGFRVWNQSESLIDDDWLTYILLPEVNFSAQFLKPELRLMVLCLLATTFSLGIIGGFIPVFDRYDLRALAFIYDPNSELFRQKYLSQHYLTLARQSYITHRSSLLRARLALNRRGSDFEKKPEASASLSFATEPYDSLNGSYMRHSRPLLRCPEWRRAVCLLNLFFEGSLACTIALSVSALIIYNVMIIPTDENIKLRRTLSKAYDNGTDVKLMEANCSDGQLNRVIADRLVDLVGKTKQWAQDELLMNQVIDESSEVIERRLIVDKIEPTSKRGIFVPTMAIGIYLVIVYGTIFPAAFLTSIADLTFSLLELRMKLEIGIHILRYYNSGVSKKIDLRCHVQESTLPQQQGAFSRETRRGESGQKISWWRRLVCHKSDTHHQDESHRYLDIEFNEAIDYALENWAGKARLCQRMAMRLINEDLRDNIAPKRKTNKFLVSTYVSIRLFEHQIKCCRRAIDYFIFFGTLQSFLFILPTVPLEPCNLKYGIFFAGLATANLFLIGTGFFQNQGQKIIGPIYSTIAWSMLSKDPTIEHLSVLWRRSLIDISSHSLSKFVFRFNHIVISYAASLQLNFTIISLYILTLQR